MSWRANISGDARPANYEAVVETHVQTLFFIDDLVYYAASRIVPRR
jgi:hypothetical protein